jgi:hypothetical protein
MPVRWRHTAEIRDRYGYRDFTGPDRFAFTVWLYRQARADEVASSVLFRAAHRQLLARQILARTSTKVPAASGRYRPGQVALKLVAVQEHDRAAADRALP